MSITSEHVEKMTRAICKVAESIGVCDMPFGDQHGGKIQSLTEAVVSCSLSLSDIAESINNLADAIRENKNTDE